MVIVCVFRLCLLFCFLFFPLDAGISQAVGEAAPVAEAALLDDARASLSAPLLTALSSSASSV